MPSARTANRDHRIGHLEFLNGILELEIPAHRFPKIRKNLDLIERLGAPMRRVKLDKECEPSTFFARLSKIDEESE